MGRHMLFVGNVPAGTLSSTIPSVGTGTFTVTGWPSSIGGSGQPFVVEIGAGLGDDEKVLCTQDSSGVVTIDPSGRGWDGTTPAQHNPGEKVRHVPDATSTQDANDHIYVTTRDDHAQYLTIARHDVNARHGASVVSHSLIGNLGNDDHAQYLNIVRHDAHGHPAGAFLTGAGAVITRSMLSGAAQGLMIGQLVARPGGVAAAEANFLLPIDGAAVSRTTWAALFAQIGTIYGAGDGSTTFNVPDGRDRVLLGACTIAPGGGRSARLEGTTGGAETVTLDATMIPSHTHTATDSGHAHTINDPQHAHNGIQAAGQSGTNAGWIACADAPSSLELASTSVGTGTQATFASPAQVGTGPASTGVTTATGHATVTNANTGGGLAHENLPPWLAVPVFIVAA